MFERFPNCKRSRTLVSQIYNTIKKYTRININAARTYSISKLFDFSELEKEGWIAYTLHDSNQSRILYKLTQSPVTLFRHTKSGATLFHIDNKNDIDYFKFRYYLFVFAKKKYCN